MNYRHDFHAGNVADACVARSRVVLRLGAEPTPFRSIETHSGSGAYELFDRKLERPAGGAAAACQSSRRPHFL
jgi:23S rRNA A2030 N6-methylase RlmJ